ncbi:uncharacterized protein LOC112680457, partial [Sipha flava]|uniref:Uncharacterized protein LOC112680457 n=1 Tax=Sipha flava TaxID=143950 RepID=A0A8B8F6T5_9HEMI
KELKSVKKIYNGNPITYKDKLNAVITSGKFEDTNLTDSISIKEDGNTYTFKSPTLPGEDYWVIQHYKTKNIANIALQDRWKQAECSIKLITSNIRGSKDVNINKKMHAIVVIQKRIKYWMNFNSPKSEFL